VAYEDKGVLYIYGVSDLHVDHKMTLRVSDVSLATLVSLLQKCEKLNKPIFIYPSFSKFIFECNEVLFLSLTFLGATLSFLIVVRTASQNKELIASLITCRYRPEINYSVEILKELVVK